MTDVATLLSEYVDALNGGAAPELNDFLARAEDAAARIELAEAIDTVLDFAPDEIRHPRAADGSYLMSVPAEQIAAAAATPWNQAMPAWRTAAGLSVEQLAERTLAGGGIASDDGNRSAAARWIAAMEAGAESARSVSRSAMDAIADALGVAHDAFARSGEAVAPPAVAFRQAGSATEALQAAEGIEHVADALIDALPAASRGSEVDQWFRHG